MSNENQENYGTKDPAVSEALETFGQEKAPEPTPVDKSVFINNNILVERSPLSALAEGVIPEYPLHLFRQTDSEISLNVSGFKNVDPSMGEEGRKWVQAIQGAQKMRVAKKLQEKNLHEGDWKQYAETGAFRSYARSIRSTVVDREVSGIRAINHVRHVMNYGEDREVPLHASGIHMTLRAIPDTELSNLETLVLAEREHIGRLTGGAGLSATAVYLVDHTIDMIINNMVKTNVELASPDELLDLILVTDVQNLAANQAHTIFPNGYPIEVPCTKDYEACQHIERYNLLVGYMSIIQNHKLTDYQRAHMSQPDRKITVKDVKKYQEEGPVRISKTVTVRNGKMRIDFRTPTLRQYIEDGRSWITGIGEMVDTIISDNLSEQQRQIMVEDQARLTTLRQYGHFINTITTVKDGHEVTIRDRETLLNTLKDLSGDDETLTAIVAGVREHIEDATITVIGVPKTPCPKCEKGVTLTEEEKLHPEYIPVDAMNLFFTLLSLKLVKRQKTKLQDI